MLEWWIVFNFMYNDLHGIVFHLQFRLAGILRAVSRVVDDNEGLELTCSSEVFVERIGSNLSKNNTIQTMG